jgi:hypothetical protein
MLIRIASIVLRVCGTLAVLLGLLFWTGNAVSFVGLHMLLGVLVVLSLWVTGVGQALAPGGSWPLAAVALLLGLVVVVVGIRQSSLLVGSLHWIIQVIHLLLGISAVGVGQAAAARSRKGGASVPAPAS